MTETPTDKKPATKSKTTKNFMIKDVREFASIFITDIPLMKNTSKKYYSKRRSIINERNSNNWKKKKLKIPLNIWKGKKED